MLMRYFGGKQRIASRLAELLIPVAAQRGTYVEPFVGGAAVMSVVAAPVRIASDSNAALITMWEALAAGWSPPENVSEATYAAVKIAADPEDPLTAFVGFGLSFAGKYFGGYARGGAGRNYASNAASSLRKKMRGLEGVQWKMGDYRECPTPRGAVIYCDPPYAGTTQYGAVPPFSWPEFWDWCLIKHKAGHAVFVSEYDAPETFREALVIPTKTDIRTKANGKEPRLEKLFVPKGSGNG
jgi:DNA adenine methylase